MIHKRSAQIEMVDNGYIVEYPSTGIGSPPQRKIYKTLGGLLQELLYTFEGRFRSGSGNSFGEDFIDRGAKDDPK